MLVRRSSLSSPPSKAGLAGLAHNMSGQVKLTASVLQTLQERLDQRGLESSSDKNLTVGGHLMV